MIPSGWVKCSKWHYFVGARSLCWRWERSYDAAFPADDHKPEDECRTCSKKLAKRLARAAGREGVGR